MPHPVIHGLLDLIEPPEEGAQARTTSDFGAHRTTGTSPHVGLDMNRGRDVKRRHGPVTSPVYGKIKEIDPELGRIVIEEWDPVRRKPTGYDVEILHTQTQTVKPDDEVKPKQQIGTQGDVGADGAYHAHVQVFHGDRTPLNPLKHLFEYHNPGVPVPPLPQFEPAQVPPLEQRGLAPQRGNQDRLLPGGVSSRPNEPSSGSLSQPAPGGPVSEAEGPTSIGGPNGPTPLVPSPRPQAAPGPTSPTDRPSQSLRYAPDAPRTSGPFSVPGLFRPDVFGGPGAASTPAGTNAPVPPTYPFGAPGAYAPASSPAAPGSRGQVGDIYGIADWRNNTAPPLPSNADSNPVGRLMRAMPGIVPVDPIQPPRNAGQQPFAGTPSFPSLAPAQDAPGGILGMLIRSGVLDPSAPDAPPAGGLPRLLREAMLDPQPEDR